MLRGLAWVALRLAKLLRIGLSVFRNERAPPLPVEIVYVAADKDLEPLEASIGSLDHLVGLECRRLVIIGKTMSQVHAFAEKRGVEFVDETALIGFGPSHYPYRSERGDRSGWLYQQMLKLAWARRASSPYLIIDADTVFLRPLRFSMGKAYIFYRSEDWRPAYADAIRRLLGIEDRSLLSFVAHMMIFDPELVAEMLKSIEKRHDMPWHKAIAGTRDLDALSCFSEYQLYAVWVRRFRPQLFRQRPLYNRYAERSLLREPESLRKLAGKLQTISFHVSGNTAGSGTHRQDEDQG